MKGSILIRWKIRDEAFLKGDFLNVPWCVAHVHDKAIDLDHPDHRIVVHATRKCPLMIERVNLQHRADGLRLGLSRAFGDTKRRVDRRELHVRRLSAVVEKVRPANRANDPTGPRRRLAFKQW